MHWLHDIVARADLAFWAEAGLIVFFVTFLAILIWVYGIRRPRDYEALRSMPLDDDDAPPRSEAPNTRDRSKHHREQEGMNPLLPPRTTVGLSYPKETRR